MNQLVKKIAAFVMLLTGAMPLLFTLFFLINQQIIRHQMKEKLEKELLQTITVSSNEIVWVKYSKEVIVVDKLFDVKSFSEKDGLYFLVGLFDAEETALVDLLERETDNKNHNELEQLFQYVQYPCPNLSFDYFTIPAQSAIFCFPILLHIPSPFINIPTPPPQA